MAEKSIHEMEASAAAIARKKLTAPLEAAIDVLNLASQLHANDVSEKRLPKPKLVRLLLLQRVQNDLRCCVILVEHGYPLQAVALAAGIFESWATLGNIRTDADAVKWLSHDRTDRSFGSTRHLMMQALKNLVGDATHADKLYSQYQQLCMAKHQNPIIERSRGYTRDGQSVEFRPGPDTSELAIRSGWYALERASRFAQFALETIADSQQTSVELHRNLEAQQSRLNALQGESARRWPDIYN